MGNVYVGKDVQDLLDAERARVKERLGVDLSDNDLVRHLVLELRDLRILRDQAVQRSTSRGGVR